MEFKQTTIAPAGRNKYGNYLSSGNVTKSVTTTVYAGNDTTTTIGNTGTTEDTGTTDFYCMLSQTNATFNSMDLVEGASASTMVIAYKGYEKGITYVCDMDSVSAETQNETVISLTAPDNMGIKNVPCGITVSFANNGTSASTIIFGADSLLSGSTGSMFIPVCVYKRSDNTPLPDDLYNWYEHKDDCETVWLEYVWNVNRSSTSNYVLDLSNQTAGVNCDSAGTLYPNSIATLQCTAFTYFNGAPATGVTYSASTQPAYAAVGFSINQNTGVMTFNSAGTKFYWYNAYPALPIDIIAYKDGEVIATKTLTITRNYPGTDGTPAHTRWITTDHDVVKYNPNTSEFSPSAVTGTIWLQVGDQAPVYDSATTIYQWYNDLETGKTSATGSITANVFPGLSSMTFALKNAQDVYYEVEDVPVLSDGINGIDGTSGASGESAWYLTLNNDNASINCDASGNVLPDAVRPTCQAKLYYGGTRITNAVYAVDRGVSTGITTSTSNGILTINFGSNFTFTGSTLEISVSGYGGPLAVLRDVKTMTVTKSIAGSDGKDAVSYWLEPQYTEIIYDPNNHAVSPGSISCAAKKQIGQGAITNATDATIKYSWQNRSNGYFTTETAYTTPITITTAACQTYKRLRFTLYVGSTQVDFEDIDIMADGLNGIDGTSGTNGENAWYLTLTNDNASINADSNGNILSGAVRPTCQAKLYEGSTRITNASYQIDKGTASGITTGVSSGILTLTFGSNFDFTGTSMSITISGYGGSVAVLRDVKTMTITKSIAGINGQDGVSYWLEPQYTEILYNPNTNTVNPSSITCAAKKQIGQGSITDATDATIKYSWQKRSDGQFTSETTYTSAINITTGNCASYSRLRFRLIVGSTQVDLEDIDIMSDGVNGTSGQSAWYLTLTNDNASINCDAAGNILSGAVRPTCQAKLYHGGTRQTNASYIVSYGNASGITTATSSGILTLTFGSNFNFTGTSLAINISGYGGSLAELRDVKIMNVTKAYAGTDGNTPYISGGTWWIGTFNTGISAEGEDGITPHIGNNGNWWIGNTDTGVKAEGADAVSYWLEPSYTEVIYDPNTNTVDPSSISCSAQKQVGQQAVVPASDAVIKYSWQYRSTGSFTSESTYTSAINITTGNCTTYKRLRLKLYVGSTQVDMEDIDILTNGIDGQPGGQGRTGAAIRGPYLWDTHSASTRCWCAGSSGGSCTECDKWIDVIYKDGTYYYCNTTYYGSLYPWTGTGGVSSAWTSGETFDFIAANLILAQNASINFLVGNEFYLRDQNGNITGGGAGGSGITFWAGAENPSDAPFQVWANGDIIANKGTFAGYIQYPYTFVSNLTYSASTTSYYADGRAYLVSDTYNQGAYDPSKLVLPTPSATWNGFTYDIIVEPTLTRSDGNQQLDIRASDNSTIYCYAYAELRSATRMILTGGRYAITCMPKHSNNSVIYRWAVTQATGGIDIIQSSTVSEYISNLVATSYDTTKLLNKIVTYTGSTKPTVPNTGNTMYVKI